MGFPAPRSVSLESVHFRSLEQIRCASPVQGGLTDRLREASPFDNIEMLRRNTASEDPQRVYHQKPDPSDPRRAKLPKSVLRKPLVAEEESLNWARFMKLAKTVLMPTAISKDAVGQSSDRKSDDLNHYFGQLTSGQWFGIVERSLGPNSWEE